MPEIPGELEPIGLCPVIHSEGAVKQACTILLIEDEALIRLGTAAMLEDAGYCVLEAGDADEALSLLASHSEIDVVVTDVQMPGTIDGLVLVEIITREFPGI